MVSDETARLVGATIRVRIDDDRENAIWPVERGGEASVQADVAGRLFEAVAEDERLRGDLTDEGYAPFLEWFARRAAELGVRPAADFERLAGALRATLAAIVRAAESGDAGDLEEVSAEIVHPSTLPDLSRALAAAAPHPDARARSMAALLGGPAP